MPGGAGATSTISAAQLATANNLLALLGGVVSAGTQSFNASSVSGGFQPVRQFQPFRYSNHSLYFQDRWQLKPGLTLTLGLRYELFPALKLDNGLAVEPVIADPNNPLASVLNRNGTYSFVGGNAGNTTPITRRTKTIWPQLGLHSLGSEHGWQHLLFGHPGSR